MEEYADATVQRGSPLAARFLSTQAEGHPGAAVLNNLVGTAVFAT